MLIGPNDADGCGFLLESTWSERLPEMSSQPVPKTEYRCMICKSRNSYFMVDNKDKLQKHLLDMHGKQFRTFCFECGKGFNSAGGLADHRRITHQAGLTHGCEICGKKFARTGHLAKHKLTHTDVRDFFCATCGKSFKHKRNVLNHICMNY